MASSKPSLPSLRDSVEADHAVLNLGQQIQSVLSVP
jgi:hypothetical protein